MIAVVRTNLLLLLSSHRKNVLNRCTFCVRIGLPQRTVSLPSFLDLYRVTLHSSPRNELFCNIFFTTGEKFIYFSSFQISDVFTKIRRLSCYNRFASLFFLHFFFLEGPTHGKGTLRNSKCVHTWFGVGWDASCFSRSSR